MNVLYFSLGITVEKLFGCISVIDTTYYAFAGGTHQQGLLNPLIQTTWRHPTDVTSIEKYFQQNGYERSHLLCLCLRLIE